MTVRKAVKDSRLWNVKIGFALILFALCLIVSQLHGYSQSDSGFSFFNRSDSDDGFLEFLFETLILANYNTRLVVLSTTLLGVSSGLVGSFLLLRKQSLMGDALSHATLPGIVLSFWFLVALGKDGKSLLPLLIGAGLSGMLGVVLVLLIRKTTKLKDDAAMGIILSVFFGLGVSLIGMVQSLPEASAAGLESFIFGKTASMVVGDFWMISFICVVSILVSVTCIKELTLLCFDESFASATGFHVMWLDLLLLLLVGAITIVGLQAVGLILIIAFLITPPAAARFWTNDLQQMLTISAVLGGVSGWIGSSISALLPKLPAGAVIVLVAASVFIFSMLFGKTGGIFYRWQRHRRLSIKVSRQHILRAVFEILEKNLEEGKSILRNLPVSLSELQQHRSWSRKELHRQLKSASRHGYVEFPEEGVVCLSEDGFGEAARVTRNHRLWELYLIRYADVAPSHVDRGADFVEHVLGPEIVRKLEDELRQLEIQLSVPPSPHVISGASQKNLKTQDEL